MGAFTLIENAIFFRPSQLAGAFFRCNYPVFRIQSHLARLILLFFHQRIKAPSRINCQSVFFLPNRRFFVQPLMQAIFRRNAVRQQSSKRPDGVIGSIVKIFFRRHHRIADDIIPSRQGQLRHQALHVHTFPILIINRVNIRNRL